MLIGFDQLASCEGNLCKSVLASTCDTDFERPTKKVLVIELSNIDELLSKGLHIKDIAVFE